MLQPLQSKLLDSFSWLKHGFFTRQGGVSKAPFDSLNFFVKEGESLENCQENWRRAAEWFEVPASQLFIPKLVHGNNVACLDQPFNQDHPPEADALVTVHPHHIVGVTIADCVPILLVEAKKRYVAAVHAGWRSAWQHIISRTLDVLEARGGQRQHIYAAIGPSIQQDSYEVGAEVYEAFYSVDPGSQTFFRSAASKSYYFDLPGFIEAQLKKNCIAEVDWLKMDTYSTPELFFSCRRNAHQGLKVFGSMMAGIMVKQVS